MDVLARRATSWVELEAGTTLWRIHATTGPHVLAWDALRTFGPLSSARFDPHPEPAREQAEAVGYFAQDWATCLAEVFQVNREIRLRRRDAHVTGFELTTTLRLVDLRDTGAVALGASHAINTGPKNVCRRWSQALREAFPEADGLATVSAMTGRSSTTLFAPAARAFPVRPGLSMPLVHGGLWSRIATAAAEIGYTVV